MNLSPVMCVWAVCLDEVLTQLPQPAPELPLVSENPGALPGQAHPGLQQDYQPRVVEPRGRLDTNEDLAEQVISPWWGVPGISSKNLVDIVYGNEADWGDGGRAESLHQEGKTGGGCEDKHKDWAENEDSFLASWRFQ